MVNLALLNKTLRDSAPAVLLSWLGLVAFSVLFVWAMQDMGPQLMQAFSGIPFIKFILEATMGISLDGAVSLSTLYAVAFTHGVTFALSWGAIIAITTRVTAGEVERGTADLLLTLPIHRHEVYITTTIAWIVCAMVISVAPLLGILIGTRIFPTEEEIQLLKYVAPSCNFLCLNLAIGGFSMMSGSLLNRRAMAVAVVISLSLFSIILNFVEPFIEAIKPIRFLGLLSYYRPVDIVRTENWPWASMGVLVLVGLACWTVGLVVFARKDIPTA